MPVNATELLSVRTDTRFPAYPVLGNRASDRDRLKKMSAASYALQHGEQKIPYRPLRKRVGTA